MNSPSRSASTQSNCCRRNDTDHDPENDKPFDARKAHGLAFNTECGGSSLVHAAEFVVTATGGVG